MNRLNSADKKFFFERARLLLPGASSISAAYRFMYHLLAGLEFNPCHPPVCLPAPMDRRKQIVSDRAPCRYDVHGELMKTLARSTGFRNRTGCGIELRSGSKDRCLPGVLKALWSSELFRDFNAELFRLLCEEFKVTGIAYRVCKVKGCFSFEDLNIHGDMGAGVGRGVIWTNQIWFRCFDASLKY